jgi:ubiquinone/menaquinone biosynthesis C-methylase UbiE
MIEKRRVFEEFAADYDRWFEDHPGVYEAQLRLLAGAVPPYQQGLEVGVGSGRFAVPLGICCGIDPSLSLAIIAKRRGVEIALGVGEYLPYDSESFDYTIMMTVICFLDNIPGVFQEVFRVLRLQGRIILGFIERDGKIFRLYSREPEKGRFLRYARFYSVKDVVWEMQDAGFSGVEITARECGFCVLTGKKAASCIP